MSPLRFYRLWRAALRKAGISVTGWKTLEMFVYFLDNMPLAPRAVWRHRMRTCGRCPIYDRKTRTCGDAATIGCGCSSPVKALLVTAKGWATENKIHGLECW